MAIENKQLRHTAAEIDDGLDKLTQIGSEVDELVNPQDLSNDFNNDFGGTTAMEMAINAKKRAVLSQATANNAQKSADNAQSSADQALLNVVKATRKADIGLNTAIYAKSKSSFIEDFVTHIESFILSKHEDYKPYNYLYIEAIDDLVIEVPEIFNIYYSSNNKEWYKINKSLKVPAGTIYYLYGDNTTLYNNSLSVYWDYGKRFNMYGNIMLLLSKDGKREITSSCFKNLFKLSGIVKAPNLPSIQTASYCYSHMFEMCDFLTEAPLLPATKVQFLAYESMFWNCKQLQRIEIKATDWNISQGFFTKGVSSTGTFIKPADTEIPIGTNGIPEGWEVINV